MKEQYFTPETIASEAERMLGRVLRFRDRRGMRLVPSRSALLVLDMQDYFLEDSSHAFVPSAPAIIPGLQTLISAYTRAMLPVIFTRHTNTRQDAAMMDAWWHDLIDPEDALSRISGSLDPSVGWTLEKNQYDAFYKTELGDWLGDKGVKQLVVGGVMTHLCCETTARSAFMHGFAVFFTIDGTATYNRAFHEGTLLSLSHGFATPVLVGEVLGTLRAYHERG
jgi:isochorismate hydrolase